MPTVESVGGELIVTALVEVDINVNDTDARKRAEDNWTELQAAFALAGRRDDATLVGGFAGNNGTVLLPAGTIEATAPTTARSIFLLDERHGGMTIQGAGPAKTVLVDSFQNATPFRVFSRRVSDINSPTEGTYFQQYATGVKVQFNDGTYAVNDVLIFWTYNLTAQRTTQRQRVRITAMDNTTNTVTFDDALERADFNGFRHYKGFESNQALSPGAISVVLNDSNLIAQFKVNDTIYITDGPAINEVWGEWVTVTGVSEQFSRINFTPPLRRSYAAGYVAVLPSPHMTDITFRDLAVAAPKLNEFGYMGTVTFGCRVRFENVDFVSNGSTPVPMPGGILNIGNSGNIAFTHCRMYAVSFNTTHDVLIDDLQTRGVGGEEYNFDFYCSNLLIDGEGFLFDQIHESGPSQRIHLSNSLIQSYAIGVSPGVVFVEGSHISNVRLTNAQNTAPIYRNDKDLVLENVTFDKEVRLRGSNLRLTNITSTKDLILDRDYSPPPVGPSSGIMLGPLLGDPTKLVIDSAAGPWLRPLYVLRDGSAEAPSTSATTKPGLILPSPAAVTIPLTVKGHSSQTGDLQQWQNSSGGILVSISKDGVFKILGSASETLSIQPGASPVNGIDMFMSSGGDLRLGSTYGGGALLTLYSNGDNQGQAYLECGNNGYAAIIMRTGMGGTPVTRFSLQHNGPLLLFTPSDTGVGVILQAAASQSANLLQCQDSSYNGLFAIRGDGKLASAHIEESAPPGDAVRRLEIFNMAGVSKGYIPIYDDEE